MGHATSIPMLTSGIDHLDVDIDFNHHFMAETKTTYHQYFPSASVILRPRNFLKGNLTRSPGSWGSDIIWMTHDWTGTFILETVELGLTGVARRNFRGYKLVPVQDKLLISRRRPSGIDRKLLSNNGFTNLIVGNNLEMPAYPLFRARSSATFGINVTAWYRVSTEALGSSAAVGNQRYPNASAQGSKS